MKPLSDIKMHKSSLTSSILAVLLLGAFGNLQAWGGELAQSGRGVVVLKPSGVAWLLDEAYSQIAGNDYAGAEERLHFARSLDPINHWVALNLSLLYLRTGRSELAVKELSRVSNIDSPTTATTVAFFANLLEEGSEDQRSANTPEKSRNLAKMRKAWSGSEIAKKSPPEFLATHRPDVKLSEESQQLADPAPVVVDEKRTVTTDVTNRCTGESAGKAIGAWGRAWEEQNFEAYVAYYQADFKGDFETPAQWRNSRRRTIASAGNIVLKLQDIKIESRENCEVVATFRQHYRSGVFNDSGVKELRMHGIDGRWRIHREVFFRDDERKIR